MEGVQDAPAVDAVARRTLAALVELPGVHRAGLALAEGGGRRLRFTASDRAGERVDWCHIDAFDDVPLTWVLRGGRPILGTLAELSDRFPDFVARQDTNSTVAVLATPVATAGVVVGGIVLYLDDATELRHHLPETVSAMAATTGADLVRAQRRTAPVTSVPTGSPALPDIVVPFDVDGALEVGAARRQLRDLLRDEGVDEEAIDDAVICLSEILTNAVMHTCAPARVRISRDRDVLHVAVRDQGSELGHRPGLVDVEDPLRVYGRGLQIVEALSTRWGADLDAAGTTAWFELELASGQP